MNLQINDSAKKYCCHKAINPEKYKNFAPPTWKFINTQKWGSNESANHRQIEFPKIDWG